MNNTDKPGREFIGYEYKEVTADSDKISFLIDGYENFGWEIDGNISGPKKMTIQLKRNRKLVNKTELTRKE